MCGASIDQWVLLRKERQQEWFGKRAIYLKCDGYTIHLYCVCVYVCTCDILRAIDIRVYCVRERYILWEQCVLCYRVPLQTLDSKAPDMISIRDNRLLTKQTLIMSYVMLCPMFIMSRVCRV